MCYSTKIFVNTSQILICGKGSKPNSNVPIVDVPKGLRRGGGRPNWDNVLKYGFFFLKASLKETVHQVEAQCTTTCYCKIITVLHKLNKDDITAEICIVICSIMN